MLFRSGARASAVFSSKRWALFRDGEPALGTILASMADMDLILVEGLKGSAWPKVVVLGGEPVPTAPPVWAVAGEGGTFSCPRFAPDDTAGIAGLILSRVAQAPENLWVMPENNLIV